ncbi:O-antigen ligase family protein, partial [Alienimonas chondri]|uniref:O-antigen ligase family protein n=1 Tax=Alienimonas chondri TaxID=2681879 RepID=UPI001487CE17
MSYAAVAVVAAVITTPWFLGTAESIQLGLATAGLAFVAGGLTLKSGAGLIPGAVWPLVGVLLLGASQALSPISGADLETTTGELAPHFVPVSVARSSTRETLAVVTLGVLTFLLASQAGVHSASRRVIWWGVAGTAAAFAVAGLVGRLGLSMQYGFRSTESEAGLTGGFFASMNRGHAAELMNLGLAAVLGLLATGGGRAAAACGVVIAAGLVVAGSRAGLAAVPVGLLCVGGGLAFLGRRGANGETHPSAEAGAIFDRQRARWVVAAGVVTVLGGAAMSLWQFEVEDTTIGRLEESWTSTFEEQISFRWEHWKDAIGVAGDLPFFGAGLGTHRYATPPYQTEPATSWATHADNQYVETLVEGGIAGLFLLAATAIGLFWGVRRAGAAGAGDAVVVAGYAVGAIAVHGAFDYGITRPPVLLTAAALLGAA